ncbi:MAG TPA: squalene/phytoene synthase family protein [Acidiphilium sp.]|nr:squalene/phytoene synthase family protein [Acidiphilium sp.]
MTEPDLAALLRRVDPDRFLGAIFAPPEARRWLFVLYAFNHELARAREVASQPPLALIRLHWWREVVEGAERAHPLAASLRAGLAGGIFSAAALTALIDAREAEAEPIPDRAAFLAYARGTAGGLARVAGTVLGVTDSDALAALEDLGTGYGIAGILRAAPALAAAGRDLLPQDGTDPATLREDAARLLRRRAPRQGLAAALPAVLARRDLRDPLARRDLRRPAGPAPRGLADRIAVIFAGLTGRC